MLFFCAVFVGAMYSGIFKEHGFLNGQVLFSSIHSIHSIPGRACPHYVLCTMRSVLGQQTSSRMAATSLSLKSTGLHFMLPERQLRMIKS